MKIEGFKMGGLRAEALLIKLHAFIEAAPLGKIEDVQKQAFMMALFKCYPLDIPDVGWIEVQLTRTKTKALFAYRVKIKALLPFALKRCIYPEPKKGIRHSIHLYGGSECGRTDGKSTVRVRVNCPDCIDRILKEESQGLLF